MFAKLFFAVLLVIAAIFSAFMSFVNIFLVDATAVILWIVTAAIQILLAVFLGVRAGSDRETDEQEESQ